MTLRRAPLPLGVLVPRRSVAARGARRARRRARVRGARAHRPRRRLRVARVRARGEGVRRPRRSRARRSRSTAARTSRCSSRARAGTRISAGCSRQRTQERASRTRGPRAAPAVVLAGGVAELNEGLVCLSGCARRGSGCSTRTPRRAWPGIRPRALLRRAPASVRARGCAPGSGSCATSPGTSAWRRSRRATSTRTTAPHAAAGRPRRDPLPHLARGLRAGAPRQP